MNRTALTRAGSVLLLTGALAALTACGAASPEPTSSPTPTPTATTAPQPTPAPTEEPPQADPTCDTIIPPDVVVDFTDAGWSFEEDVFRLGATEIPEGITCTWGDAKVASDNVQMFGWAPISEQDSAREQSALVQEGWQREEGEDGVFLTENPDTAVNTDADGYGWTYQFGDGWVKFADTKQGLLLVEWPPAD